MKNTRVLVAILMAVLLVGGMFVMLPKASAQSAQLQLLQTVRAYFTDGTFVTVEELSPFSKASIAGNGKTIASLEFRSYVQTQPPTAMVVNSAPGATFKISVLTPSGFVDMSTAGADTTPKKLFGIDDTKWQIFALSIPAASFDSALGARTSDFSSQIRFTTSGPGSTITVNANVGGSMSNYIAFPVNSVYPFTAKSTGGVDPEPCTVNCNQDDPSGVIFYRITIQRPDGTWIPYISLSQLSTFNLFVTGCTGVNCVDFKAISYEKWVQIDNDVWNVPNKIIYDNPGSSGNYGIAVNGQSIPIVINDELQAKGSDKYIVLSMVAQESDIRPKLTDHGPNSGTAPGEHLYSGTISFLHSHATMTLQSPSRSYNIGIPQQTVTINIGGLANPDLPDPCEISGGVANCPDEPPVGLPFGLTYTQLYLAAVGGIIIIGGIVMATRKRKGKK